MGRYLGFGHLEEDDNPVYVERWYSRQMRVWVLTLRNADGNPVGDSQFFGFKNEAIAEENGLLCKGLKKWRCK